MVLPASMSTDSQTALDSWLAECEKSAPCSKDHPQLRSRWKVALSGLPRTVVLANPLNGREETVVLTRDTVLGWVRAPLYAPAAAAALPLAIEEAAQGRWSAIMGLGGVTGGQRSADLALGMHLSVVCAEDYPRLEQSADRAGADFADYSAQLYRTACARWPRGVVSADFYRIAPATAPSLVLSGTVDPVTPPRHGERVARALGPMAQHVVVPSAGHGVMAIGCMRDVVSRFIDARDASALPVDASCAMKMPLPAAFVPYALGGSAP